MKHCCLNCIYLNAGCSGDSENVACESFDTVYEDDVDSEPDDNRYYVKDFEKRFCYED